MRPICLRGHERAITRILFNREGDLIFTAGKNPSPSVWFAQNGERLGTFVGHQGVIWCLDVNWSSTHLISGSGDSTVKLWDISNGQEINSLTTETPVRACGFSYSGNIIFAVTDAVMKKPSEIQILDIRVPEHMNGTDCVVKTRGCGEKGKITSAVWGDMEDFLITGCDNGEMHKVDARTGEILKSVKEHSGMITEIEMHIDRTMFITSSKDHTAKLFGTHDLETVRTYTNPVPVNSAAISPNRPHILLGGGQEAREVTTTAMVAGKFDARFFHMIYAEEFGSVKGHFGPINSVSFRPDGTGFATGGEDGYVRLHTFDDDYEDIDQKLFNVPPTKLE